jgi:hypothetical protein
MAVPAQDADTITRAIFDDRDIINTNFNILLTEITTGIENLPTEFHQEITQVFVPTDTLKETTVQIVEQREGEPVSIDYTLTSDILCSLAKSDAKHDFGNEMVPTASLYIPNTGATCIASPEDTFMHAHIYGKPILENYEHVNVAIAANLDDVFAQRGIQDVYLIVDTYSSGLRDQLVKGKDIINPPVKYFWVENRQTQYDPAGKTHPKSSAGKVLFTNNNKLQYAREIIKTNGILYPPWDVTDASFNINKFATKNKLFYSTNTIFQIAEKMTDGSINTRCIMKTPDNKYVVMDKEMSKISKGLFNSITYAALFNKLRVHIDNFINPANNAPPADFTDAHHTVAKRLGDQGQALSTLPDKMLLETMDGKGFESSGNHASVSIDRLAIAAALQYRAPIIIYCRYDGSLDIYIRKDKIGNDGYIKNLQEKQKTDEINKYITMYDRIFTGGKTIETIISDITTYNSSITVLKQTLTTAINADIGTTNDSYKTYIKNIFSALTNINMKTNINPPENLRENPIRRADEIPAVATLSEVKKEVAKLEQLESIQKQLSTFTVQYNIANDKLNNKKINEIRLFTQIRTSRALETLGDTICGGSYLSFIVDELLKKQYTELYAPFKAKLTSIFAAISTTYADAQLHTYLIAYIETILAKLPTEATPIQALIRNEERNDEYAEQYPEFIVTHMPLSQFISPNSIFITDNPVQPQVQQPAVTGGKQIQKGGYNDIESIYKLEDIQKILVIILLYASQHNIKVEGVPIKDIVGDPDRILRDISDNFIKTQLSNYFTTNVIDYNNEGEQFNSEPNTQIVYLNAIEYEIYKYPELKSLYTYITNIIESKKYKQNMTRIILNKRLSYLIYILNTELTDNHILVLDGTLEKYTIPLFFQSIVHDLIYKDGNIEGSRQLAETEQFPLIVNTVLEKNIYKKILTKSNIFRQLMTHYNILDLINYINNLGRYNQKYIEYNQIIVTTSQPAQLIDEYKKLSQTELANKKETIIKNILKDASGSNLARLKEQQGEEDVCILVKKLKHQTTPNINTAIDSTQLSNANKTEYKAAIKFINNLIQLKNIYLQMHSVNLETTTEGINISRPQTLIAAAAGGGSKRKSKRSKTKYHRKTTRKRLYIITRRKNRK